MSMGDDHILLSIIRDITERKRAENTLRMFQYSIDQAFDAVFWMTRMGGFSYVNNRACTSLGYTREELMRLHLWDIDPLYPQHLWSSNWVRYQENRQGGNENLESVHKRKDETTFPVDVTSTHLWLGDDELHIAVVRDITERKQTDEQIHRINQELEGRVADRTAALEAANKELEAFAYSVSHDLRAPLRAIDGYSRILVEDHGASLDSEGQRVCSVIHEETKRMGGLIDDLLAFSRLSRSHVVQSEIDMTALVNSVFSELTTPEVRKRLDFRMHSIPKAMGDPHLIRQVWTNLFSNAIKFSSRQERPTVEVNGRESGNEIVYSVTDNGAGFDMQYAGKLFGVFQRLHSTREFEGTGVGLAIVQRIIHRHGGRVWAEGQPDQGATFYFTIPWKGT